MMNRCAAPAPIPDNVGFGFNGTFGIIVRGLNIHGDTALAIAPVGTPTSEITIGEKTVAPSATDILGAIITDITLANGTNGDVFEMFLVGPCGTRVYVGNITFSFPP
jgi:hypothetical protein